MNAHEAKRVLQDASVLKREGMVLEARHYLYFKQLFLKNQRLFLTSRWFGAWLAFHKDDLIRTLDERRTPTKFAQEFAARNKRNARRRMMAWQSSNSLVK